MAVVAGLAAATGGAVLECSSVLSPGIPSTSSLRRQKPCSRRRGCFAKLDHHNANPRLWSSVLAWNHEGPERRWKVAGTLQVRAVTTTSSFTETEAWLASDEATTIAAAEEAMALARAAVLAAREAAEAIADDSGEMELANEPLAGSTLGLEQSIQLPEVARIETTEEAEETALQANELLSTEAESLERKYNVEVAVTSRRRKQRMMKRAQAAEKRKNEMEDGDGETIKGLFPAGSRKVVGRDRYCPQISRRTRMSAAEELEAINGIQEHIKMEALFTSMSEQLGREPTFREWAEALKIEPQELRRKLKHAKRCRTNMVSSNLGLVIKVARKFGLKGTTIEDLIQEGINGLLHGVEKFDTSRGFRLSTYVLWWIELSVRRASVKRSIMCQVPMHLFDTHTRVLKTRARIFEERGTFPTNEEVATILGTTAQKVHLAANLMRHPKSLDDNVPGCDNVTLLEILPDPEVESSLLVAEKALLKEQLDKVLNLLKPREKEVLTLRYGIGDGRDRTLEELSHHFNLSRERVRQIEKRALAKIHELGGKELLASFVKTFTTNTDL
ncbi:uncharacterized protein LOC9660574 [Selaginella moellendorffii]|nr:uncharacterized protein LOC9660574 [Selaginella moellendorffii]|eukprot:XP_002990998.2 uncharacterized protein LOC9660574 [Selaginella moellendorffii]